jgi:putrescine transport system permease protein
MHSRWLWRTLAVPGVAWLSIFFLVALYAVLSVALGNQDTLSQPIPFWNPLDWNTGYLVETLRNFWQGQQFLTVFLRTFAYVAIALALSLIIGYPVAYYAARHAGRWRGLVLLGLILPFWINYLMRMLAWINLLSPDGWGTQVLHWVALDSLFVRLGLLSAPGGWLDGQSSSVVIALVYGYIPYLILPVFAGLDRIDQSQIEAARDLGATPWQAWRRVTLPLSWPSILAGSALVVLPMFGDYYTNDLISASPRTNMLGNQINLFVQGGSEKNLGASLVIVLMAILAVLMAYYLFQTARDTKRLATA